MANERETWLDSLKGFAIILIVLGHTIERIKTGTGYDPALLHFTDVVINRIHNHIFFITSGFLVGKYGRERLTNRKEVQHYLKNRSLDLLLPYCYFAILTWVGKFIFSDYVVHKVGISDLLLMFINPVAFMWYIYVLFLITVIVLYLMLLTKQNDKIVLLVSFFLLVFNVVLEPSQPLVFRICQNCFIFVLGIYVAKNQSIFQLNSVFVLLGVLTAVFSYLSYVYENQSEFIFAVTNVSSSLFFLILFYRLRHISFKIFNKLGNETFYIYIMNPIILNAIKMVFLKADYANILIWFITMMICGLGLPMLYSLVAKRIWIFEIIFKPRKYIKENNK